MRIDKPLVLPIKKIIKENEIMNTYYFDYRLNSKPGQFIMLWIPGVDEKPFAIAKDNGDSFFITVAAVGPATQELARFQVGDKVGIRGPYGNSFRIDEHKHLVLVGGGYGTAVLFSVLHEAKKKGCTVDFITGSRSQKYFILQKEIRAYDNLALHLCTDDGSAGTKGFTTDVLQMLLKEKFSDIDEIFTCGPELMMKKVSDIAHAHNIPAQLSIERYMKCAFGICGNCVLDNDGTLVCRHGTIFDNETARMFTDFGHYHRDAEGRKHYYNA